MSAGDWLMAVWAGVGFVVAVCVWIDNSRVYYVHGDPPSGLFYGLTWPLWAPFALLLLALYWLSERRPTQDPTP